MVNAQFDNAGPFSQGLTPVLLNKKSGYVNPAGKMVIAPQFYEIGPFVKGLARVRLEAQGRYGFIDQTGKMVIPPQFHWAHSFSEGLAAVQTELRSGYAYIDKTGAVVIPGPFPVVGDFSEGLACVMVGGSGAISTKQAGWSSRPNSMTPSLFPKAWRPWVLRFQPQNPRNR